MSSVILMMSERMGVRGSLISVHLSGINFIIRAFSTLFHLFFLHLSVQYAIWCLISMRSGRGAHLECMERRPCLSPNMESDARVMNRCTRAGTRLPIALRSEPAMRGEREPVPVPVKCTCMESVIFSLLHMKWCIN